MILRPLPLSRLSLCLASLAIPPLMSSAHAASLHWDGGSTGPDAEGGAGTWSTATDVFNWDSAATAGSDVAWTDGSDAVFGGSGGAVTVSGTVSATSLNFAAAGYSTTGGTIALTGTPLIDVAGNDVTLGSVLSGSAAIRKTGTGTLTLSAYNTFSGQLTIEQGTVKTSGSGRMGGTTNGTVVLPGATFDVNGNYHEGELFTISGAGVNGAGAIVNTGPNNSEAVRQVALAGPATVGGTARWDIRRLSSVGFFTMGGHTLTKTGPASVHLVSITVGSPGNIDIQQGSFWVESSTSLGGSAANKMTVRSGAALRQWDNAVAQNWTADFEPGSSWIVDYRNSRWAGPVILNGATTFDMTREWNPIGVLTTSGVISGAGSLRKVGPGTLELAAANTYTGGTTVDAGTLVLNAAGFSGIGALRGPLTVNAGATLNLPVQDSLGYVGGLRVSELNINGGLVDLPLVENEGVPVANYNRVPALNFSGGMLRTNGGENAADAINYYLLANDGVLNSLPAADTAVLSGRLQLGTGVAIYRSHIHVEKGDAAEGLRIDAAITGSNPSSGFRKDGDGLMVLNGPAVYPGLTQVEDGTLLLGQDGELPASTLQVEDGGGFGVKTPGKTLAAITAQDGSTLILPAVADATTTVSGALDLTSGSIAIAPVLGADTAAGTYDLITAGSITGSGIPVLDLSAAYGPTRASGSVAVNGNKLQLTVTGTGADLLWNNASAGGVANGTWNATLANFSSGTGNEAFQAFDSVTFPDGAGGTRTIALEGLLAPARLTVDNSATNYVFSSSGALAGAGSLVKTGSGTLTLAGPNSYTMTGPITAAGGVLDFGHKTITAAGLTLAGGQFNNATARLAAIDLQAGSSNARLISTAPWRKTTAGDVSLTNANAMSAPGSVEAGTLFVGNPAAPDTTATLGGSALIGIATGARVVYSHGEGTPVMPHSFSGGGELHLVGVKSSTNVLTQFQLTGDNRAHTGPLTLTNARITAENGTEIGSGPLRIDGRASVTIKNRTLANAIDVAAGGTWSNGSGASAGLSLTNVTLSGPITVRDGMTFSFSSAASSRNAISGPIAGVGPAGLLYFSGSSNSEMLISGATGYTGFIATAGTGSTLRLNGSTAATTVTVGSNTALAGSGTIGSGGALTFNNLGTLKTGMAGSALTVNGDVTLAASTKVALEPGPGTVLDGPVTILNYTGTLNGTTANLAMDTPAHYRKAVFAIEPGRITLDVGVKELDWKGSSGAAWQLQGQPVWSSGISSVIFCRGDHVRFADRVGLNVITIGGTSAVQPSSVLVNNSLSEYRIPNIIEGGATFTKAGNGKLVRSGISTYSGGTTVNGGVLDASAQSLGTGPVLVNAGGTLAGDAVIPGAVTIHGTVDPASSVAIYPPVIQTGPLVLTGTYRCQLDTTTNDRLTVTGDLNLTGSTLVVEPVFNSASAPENFTIASYTGNLTGSFATVSGMPAGYALKVQPEQKRIVIALSVVADWAAGYPGLADTTPDGDPDRDGMTNLMEYTLAGDPGVPDASKLPLQTLTEDSLIIRYRRNDLSRDTTTQTIQWGSSLGTWSEIPVTLASSPNVQVVENGSAPDDITVTIPRVPGKMFARLKVVEK
ncbi:autotransporter-associated beta strand repeat-containing protein [Luteolibacter sp. GHJ8]|uniref:Autotransporter-associated beta strand repeat-containing protein n=1 Tax=Luteolibacter rhizosphaerae TaxID=2989719 RepID=A0ABT3G9W0_9BACT|nr:autotransporter-associated beta strand repeat-containing protein [Luteolibacter rhizosphaerae]MCW1916291.1 autotransporter-associated beta strand repeat-containing protein [Luteolibacter rhizosphaerae]